MKKKVWIIILLLVVIVAAYWYYSSTQWERDFDIRYVEYVRDGALFESSDYSYYLYEITNKTNRVLTDVYAVIEVTDYTEESFEYDDLIERSIRPGETVEYKIYTKDYKKAAEKQGEDLGMIISVDIVKIEYSK